MSLTPRTVAVLYYVVAAAVTFVVYAVDKRAAGRSGRRVAERTLHLLALAGGFLGAIAGQQMLRHKTRKPALVAVAWIALVLHVLAWMAPRFLSE